MTLTEQYKVWLENNVIPFAGPHAKQQMTKKMNDTHDVFKNVNNTDDDANHNAVKELCDAHDKASDEVKKHMRNHIMKKGNEEMAWQLGEHKPEHPLTKAVNKE
jgi:hypothetical protein